MLTQVDIEYFIDSLFIRNRIQKRLIVSCDTPFRCASEPKQTARTLCANRSNSSVKGMLSHATFSLISYTGIPSALKNTCTVPVGNGTTGNIYSNFFHQDWPAIPFLERHFPMHLQPRFSIQTVIRYKQNLQELLRFSFPRVRHPIVPHQYRLLYFS